MADAFRRNFTERGEIGAACAFYRSGRKVVDLWGGYRDGIRRLPWQQDTLVTVFSATKGMSSLAIPVAHSRGLLDVDEPVATYWPEFAQHGKAAIMVGSVGGNSVPNNRRPRGALPCGRRRRTSCETGPGVGQRSRTAASQASRRPAGASEPAARDALRSTRLAAPPSHP